MFKCEVCGKSLKTAKGLRDHVAALARGGSPEHEALCCLRSRCGFQPFPSALSKQQHQLSSLHHRVCVLCPEHWDYHTKKQLSKHFATEHPGVSPGNSKLATTKGLIGVTDVPHSTGPSAPTRGSRPRLQVPAPVVTVSSSPLDRFFATYRSFRYDASKPPATSYQALVRHFGWDRQSTEAETAKTGYQDALRAEVEIWFGGEDDIEAWHTLCRAVGIRNPPSTIPECTRVLRNTHVNIVDLVDWGRNGGSGSVRVFSTQPALVGYSIKNEKIFPSRQVQADGETNVVLRHLLRRFGRM